MKIVHSIGVKFARDGIGYIAYQRTAEVYRRGFLKRVMAPSFAPSEIGERYCLRLPLSERLTGALSRFLPLSRQYLVRDRVFDWSVARNLPDADIFHGWTSQALFSMRGARARGQMTFLERPNSHPFAFSEIMKEEYRINSVRLCPVDPILLDTQIRECDEADFVIVPSVFAYESFLKEGFDPARLLLVPFGVDAKRFRPAPRSAADTVFRVVFVGQIGLRKGVHYLLEAWSRLKLKDAELVLAGWLHPDIVNTLKRYKALPDVTIGAFTLDTAAVYQTASVCVFPSIEDGFGLVVLEAMACGVPVIVTENTGAKDAVTHDEDGFIVPIRDVEALKEKISYFYTKREECRRMGDIAVSKARAHTWDICAEKLIEAYRNAVPKTKDGDV